MYNMYFRGYTGWRNDTMFHETIFTVINDDSCRMFSYHIHVLKYLFNLLTFTHKTSCCTVNMWNFEHNVPYQTMKLCVNVNTYCLPPGRAPSTLWLVVTPRASDGDQWLYRQLQALSSLPLCSYQWLTTWLFDQYKVMANVWKKSLYRHIKINCQQFCCSDFSQSSRWIDIAKYNHLLTAGSSVVLEQLFKTGSNSYQLLVILPNKFQHSRVEVTWLHGLYHASMHVA